MNWPTVHAGITGRRRLGPARYGADEVGASSWVLDPLNDWSAEGRNVAAFAMDLVQTDPYAAAMLTARLNLTLGAKGLEFRSLYQADGDPKTDQEEIVEQQRIEDIIADASSGTCLDAGRTMTRKRLESAILSSAIVAGDGFAVRAFKPNRVGCTMATCWRVVHYARVRNPLGCSNYNPILAKNKVKGVDGRPLRTRSNNVIYEGIEITRNGKEPVALWIAMPDGNESFFSATKFMRVPYYAPNGSRNVIHAYEQQYPGQLRGFSAFSPAFMTFKHLKGTTEAHMVGKRALACHPLFLRSRDPEVAARFARMGAVTGPNSATRPGMMTYIGEDGEVISPGYSYQGSDFREYIETVIRPATAMWGLPWQFVLNQLTNANLASSRAALDQTERTSHGWQDDQIGSTTSVLDRSILEEGEARSMLRVPLVEAMKGYYLRPRRWSTDRKKEADADWLDYDMGKSLSSIFAERGSDFRREAIRKKSDMEFLERLGMSPPSKAPPPVVEDEATESDDFSDEVIDDDGETASYEVIDDE